MGIIKILLEKWIQNKILLSVWLLCTFLAITILYLDVPQILSEQLKLKLFPLLVKSSSILLLIATSLTATLVVLQRKNNEFNGYKFHPTSGSWIHDKDIAKRACAYCKTTRNVFSPLSLGENYFICPGCDKKTPNIPTVMLLDNSDVEIRVDI